jgi:non-haem Fe2+, alpha-ketoglutarate-dependent halogenase
MRLSREQVERYERDGILFPIPVLDAEEVAGFRGALEALRARLGGNPKPARMSQPQLHFRWAWDLATHPAVLDAVEDLLGPDILVHSASVFHKPARDPGFVSWHQDGHYWNMSESRLVSAWIALSPSTAENGCLQVVPGSHRERLTHTDRPGEEDNLLASGLRLATDIDEDRAADVVLAPGEMSLHHLNLIHGSEPNGSGIDRVGFAVRYVAPAVRQSIGHHAVILARGRDEHGHFTLQTEPPPDDLEAGVASLDLFLSRNARKA